MLTTAVIMIAILLVLAALGVPVYMALLGSTFYLMSVNNMPFTNIVTGLYEALTKTSLMAVPFFVFAGSIMANTSLGRRLINLFAVTLRRFKAGLAISCLASNAVFGAISGSAPAATATFGKIVYKPMYDQYGDDLAVGLITSSGALSTIIPPSIMMIMYGIATESSITQLFLAGIIPGLLIVLVVGIYLAWRARKNERQPTPTLKEIGRAFYESLPVILMPVIVLGGIYGGFCTPTEAGAVAAVYSLIVGVFILRDIKLRHLLPILRDAAITTAQVFILIAVSSVFAQATTIARFQTYLLSLMSGLSPTAFLIILNIVLLFVGCFFEGGSATLILAPLLLPVATSLGIDIMHLGIIFVINLSIGMFTPPFGLNIFVTQSVLGKSMGMISKSLVPFIILYVVVLLLITFIPQLSLVLLG
ncbi:MAG: TRAP transporter large permease [Oscillospiraceae bacterium]|jgi:C4-dicarboxylate transporter DctM subunit